VSGRPSVCTLHGPSHSGLQEDREQSKYLVDGLHLALFELDDLIGQLCAGRDCCFDVLHDVSFSIGSTLVGGTLLCRPKENYQTLLQLVEGGLGVALLRCQLGDLRQQVLQLLGLTIDLDSLLDRLGQSELDVGRLLVAAREFQSDILAVTLREGIEGGVQLLFFTDVHTSEVSGADDSEGLLRLQRLALGAEDGANLLVTEHSVDKLLTTHGVVLRVCDRTILDVAKGVTQLHDGLPKGAVVGDAFPCSVLVETLGVVAVIIILDKAELGQVLDDHAFEDFGVVRVGVGVDIVGAVRLTLDVLRTLELLPRIIIVVVEREVPSTSGFSHLLNQGAEAVVAEVESLVVVASVCTEDVHDHVVVRVALVEVVALRENFGQLLAEVAQLRGADDVLGGLPCINVFVAVLRGVGDTEAVLGQVIERVLQLALDVPLCGEFVAHQEGLDEFNLLDDFGGDFFVHDDDVFCVSIGITWTCC